MANGAFKFKDNSGNVVSHISGSGANIYFSGGTLDLSGMTGLTLGNLTLSGTTQNAQTASFAPSYLLTSSFNTYSSSYAITGSNTFIGNQTISGSIIPAVSASYDLGSVNYPFRHLYLSSASLYVNGTKVLGSTAQELQITTDAGQSFKILESSSDTITLQSADGNITLASSGGGDVIMDPTNGVIGLKGTVTVYTGNKVVSSDGNSIQFGNGIAITGSIVSTVTPLVSGSSQIIYSGLTGIPSGIISGSSQLTSSYDGRYVLSGSITQTTWDNIASKPSGIASGSSQIDITGTTGYSTFSSSISTSIGGLSSSVATTTSGLSSTIGSLSSSVATTTSGLSSSVGSLSSSVATTTSGLSSSIGNLSSSVATTTSGLSSSIGSLSSSVATTTLGTKNRVDSIEAKTGSYATTGSNIFKDNQTISGSLIVTQNLTVFGSSSITYVTSSQLRVDDNIITLNTSSPGSRFGGLEVYDSGSVTQATGSILWDSVNNRWVYQQSSEATYGGGVLMSGPRSSGSLGSELTLTSGRVAKSAGGDHLNDSNITDDGTLVSINSNTEVTGTLKVTSTITGTLSGNASTATSSSYSSTATSSSYANTTTSSSYASTATSSSYATNSTSSSYATTAGTAGSATSATTAATASYVAGANVSGNISGNAATATSSSYATTAGTAGSATSATSATTATTAATASYVAGANVSGNISGNAATATTAATASYVLGSNVSGNISGNAATATTAATASYVLGSNVSGNISGNAGTVTGGVYTTGDQSISGTKTFAVIKGDSGADYPHSFTNTDAGNTHWTNRGGRMLTSNGTNWASDGKDPIMAIVGSTADTTRGRMIGITFHNDNNTVNAFSPTISFSAKSNSTSYNSQYASIYGRNSGTASGLDTNWNKGELHFTVHGDSAVSDTPTLRLTQTTATFDTSLTVTGTIGASNFSGTHSGASSGTNTGDQTSVSGNAGTVTNGVYTTGDQTIGGAKTFSSRVSVNGTLAVNTSNDSSTSTGGITFWDAGNTTTSWIGFKNASNSGWGTHGGASATYHTYFVMDTASRGWIFRYASPGGTDFSGTNVASISNTGRFATNNGYQFTFNGTNRGGIYAKTTWFGSGSDYSPSMCAEGGLNFNVYVDGSTTKGTTIDTSGHLYPVGNGTQNLGGTSNRWATVYTSDLSLNNGIGDYTIVEGEEKLYLYNNKNNKVYSFVLQEEDPSTATPKKI